MRLIRPSVEILSNINTDKVMKHLERCGRTCYKSEEYIADDSASKFLRTIIRSGHESVVEHFNITVRFICDRSTTHQIVRHRIASYSQESQRYCNYTKDKFGNEITFILPQAFADDYLDTEYATDMFSEHGYIFEKLEDIERVYFNMLEDGFRPEEARMILPNCTKTELVMTANIREWRHFLKERTSKAADPQIKAVSIPLLNEFKDLLPDLFFDIEVD